MTTVRLDYRVSRDSFCASVKQSQRLENGVRLLPDYSPEAPKLVDSRSKR